MNWYYDNLRFFIFGCSPTPGARIKIPKPLAQTTPQVLLVHLISIFYDVGGVIGQSFFDIFRPPKGNAPRGRIKILIPSFNLGKVI